uniref:Methuselah N-terminal domain-containing protein n=1 Tax=Sipha flava TaxID=143950 RepID=A0A2S2PZZ0_9HEMI
MSFIKMRLSHNLVPLCNSRTWHRHNLPYPCYAIICPCRSLSVVILLVLLLSTLSETAVDHACPMSISEPVTDEARLVDGMLRIGNPERVYDASQFRFAVNGSGYELCTCTLKPCVLKCCDRGYLKNLSCPVPDDNESIRSFMVSSYVLTTIV